MLPPRQVWVLTTADFSDLSLDFLDLCGDNSSVKRKYLQHCKKGNSSLIPRMAVLEFFVASQF
jgi:hypothetical protein